MHRLKPTVISRTLSLLTVVCLITGYTATANISLSGVVNNAAGKPVPGATVYVIKQDTVQTDAQGKFALSYAGATVIRRTAGHDAPAITIRGNNVFVDNPHGRTVVFEAFGMNGARMMKRVLAPGTYNRSLPLTLPASPLSGMSVCRVTIGTAPYLLTLPYGQTGGGRLITPEGTSSAGNSLAKQTAVPCTILVSKPAFVNKSFPQQNNIATGLMLVIDSSVATSTCNPPCTPGQVCRDERCVSEADLERCISETNRYRATLSLPPLVRNAALEEYAAVGARYDAGLNSAHAHFKAYANYQLTDAENEIPGWSLTQYKTVSAIIDAGLKMMWGEGPGGGHYENIKGSHTKLGCGCFTTSANGVWVVQDFK